MSGIGSTRNRRSMPGRFKSVPARRFFEGGITTGLIFCGLFSLFTTAAIIFTLAFDGFTFFKGVEGRFAGASFWEFITGLKWTPLLGGERHFGIWPLMCGTFMVTAVAMLVAGPLGMITAIWLAEYAPSRIRNLLKPVLEVIAGIPTVVLGFFAIIVITPTLQMKWIPESFLGAFRLGPNPLGIDFYNTLSAGIAVGILTLPIVTSLAEDALRAVPKPLREASYGLGATRFETSLSVVVPAALSGIIASFLLAIARCVGETMIVALAAGGSVVPLHYLTEAPSEVKIWHESGMPQPVAPVQTLADGSTGKIDNIRLSRGDKIDELELALLAGSTAKQMKFDLLTQDGKSIATNIIDVQPIIDTSTKLNWEIPKTEIVAQRNGSPDARPYGARLDAGNYTVQYQPLGGTASIGYLNLDGERYMSVLKRAAVPVDVTQSMQPMTGYLVQIFLGDVSNLGIEYYSSYAVAGVLFIVTFVLTLLGHFIRVRFQQQYE
jgi:phosphate transport system permease protein